MPSYRLSQTMDRSAMTARYPRMTPEQRRLVQGDLRDMLGPEAVVSDPDQLLAYSYDATGERHFPDVVVLPSSVAAVQTALRIAHAARLPVIGRGASTNLSGGTTPLVGGMVVSFARMNHILEIDAQGRTVRVEPGVVNADLQAALSQVGFFYPPDPSSHRISTIGGNVAENSGGPHCVKYGVTTHHVLGIQVALADGTLVNLPRIGDTSQGIDLASVVIGSEGTLALVTEATLSIQPLPETTQTLLVSFPTVAEAMRTVSALVAARLNPATLELMDRDSLKIIESFVHAGYPVDAGAVLLIELDGQDDEVQADARTVQAIAAREGSISFQAAASAREAEALWRGRRAHYGATARLAPHLWVQDVTVPRPKLAEMMDRVLEIGERQGLLIVTAAHAGDGNLHPTIPYDPQDPGQVARLRAADHEILQACVELGGAITGEHGIGIDKAEHLPLMYSPDELQVMHAVKEAFDPDNLLNPFKALWPPGALPGPQKSVASEPPTFVPRTAAEVQDAMRWARDQGWAVAIRGQGRRRAPLPTARQVLDMRALDAIHDVDIGNLSVEVGAGLTAGALARLLHQEGVDLPGVEPFMDDTIGGLVASNAPYWRNSLGRGWRDVLLAVEWVDSEGRLLRFGRKTMKNVAGYDIAKLLVGSHGRLGAITRVTLKVRPAVSSIAVALSEPMDADRAVATAKLLLADSVRPDGILLVKEAGSDRVSVWCADNFSRRQRREWLERILPGPVTYHERIDAWLHVERDRLHRVYQAISQNEYRNGLLALGANAVNLFRGSEGAAVHFCPGSGWYEMMGEGDFPSTKVAADTAVERLRERVIRVFDPGQRLGW